MLSVDDSDRMRNKKTDRLDCIVSVASLVTAALKHWRNFLFTDLQTEVYVIEIVIELCRNRNSQEQFAFYFL